MRILMMSNTYAPHVGGVARSIERFARRYRALGHGVRVVAPHFDGLAADEAEVVRVPAVRHFNHTDFSLALPVPHPLGRLVETFLPEVVHSHHPFLIGGTALRIAHTHDLPLVFTHHTKYEDYTHNVPGDSPTLKRFVEHLATNYANLCDRVFVPSESIAALVARRGVTAPVSVVPTGVELDAFARGDRAGARAALSLPPEAFVVGHLGRLTVEKNIARLAEALARFVARAEPALDAHCLVYGAGPLERALRERFAATGLASRLRFGGVVAEDRLADAYHAMDVFAFASLTETQGMVLTEAMASGLPVVAVDAPGVREVVEDGLNGRLLATDDAEAFAEALAWLARRDADERAGLARAARATAERFSIERTADTALGHYARLREAFAAHRRPEFPRWTEALRAAGSEWALLQSATRSIAEAWQGSADAPEG